MSHQLSPWKWWIVSAAASHSINCFLRSCAVWFLPTANCVVKGFIGVYVDSISQTCMCLFCCLAFSPTSEWSNSAYIFFIITVQDFILKLRRIRSYDTDYCLDRILFTNWCIVDSFSEFIYPLVLYEQLRASIGFSILVSLIKLSLSFEMSSFVCYVNLAIIMRKFKNEAFI